MAYRIKLTPYTPEQIRISNRNTFRLKVVASDAEDMPNAIFLHQRTLVDPTTGEQQDEFVNVCSPFDLSTYPASEPAAGQSPAFFRKDTLDILLPGIGVVDDDRAQVQGPAREVSVDAVLADLEGQVNHLIALMEALDRLEAQPPIWCPSAPAGESSSSSSSSSSSLGV